MNLRNAMKQSCDTYFYEIARKLGVDKLSETAKKFGLGKEVFGNLFSIEKKGLIPNTEWKKNALGKGWLLGETMITGIGQGYIQTTPIQLCLMTAQIANGGYKIYPKIIVDNEEIKSIDPTFMNVKTSKFPEDKKGELVDSVKISWPVDPEKRKSDDEKEDITVTITIAPKELREGRGDGKSNPNAEKFKKIQKERNMNEDWNGVSIMRNDREVFFGYPHPWTGGLDLNQPRGRWIGFEISFKAVHDKSFVVKNIKTGAKPVRELKKAITAAAGPLYKNALEKVKQQWDKYEADLEIESRKSTTGTGHEVAENIAKGQKGPKDALTQNKDENKLNANALGLLDEQSRQARAAWEAKFQSQPYTIVDGEWKGDDFVQIAYTKEGAVMKYNLSHPLHKEIINISTSMENESDPEKLKASAKRLKVVNDLILLSFCKAEKQNDETMEINNTEDFLEDLRLNWGRYLKRYVKDYKE